MDFALIQYRQDKKGGNKKEENKNEESKKEENKKKKNKKTRNSFPAKKRPPRSSLPLPMAKIPKRRIRMSLRRGSKRGSFTFKERLIDPDEWRKQIASKEYFFLCFFFKS